MLPGLDGIGVCRRLREAGSWVPVLLLTARDGVGDRVRGLDAGAEDYRRQAPPPRMRTRRAAPWSRVKSS
jgi:DNA-binding response OmpR family regulator